MGKFKIAVTEHFARKINSKKYNFLSQKINDDIYPILRNNPFFGENIKKLRGEYKDIYRFRLGDYRLFYKIEEQEHLVFIIDIGRSQAVRLPKEFQFKGENVYIQKVGEAVILVPFDKDWEVFMQGINSFSEDFMAEGRLQGNDQERENL